ncbi:MAG: alpha-ketoacid dehydrogenase subunit beta [Hahellaceae bacterium]|nr:alpha-ketoacid dehydrogenase subunit beta [Hahellaceae bacterium]MCP5168395.1 alpha-ketoacid dehydrogenase subunit beta [Hahellaceae bacterium]
MTNMTMVEAINLAMAHELNADPDLLVMGEDVGMNGGVFRATVDLRKEFGRTRVIDTPLAETMIVGTAIGMATQGLHPVAEIQFMGFVYPAMEQLICHAARMRNRTRGRLSCPLVIRAPFGGGIHAPEHHSESTEALFAHIPGLRVVIPSSPLRAYRLLLAAIRNPDPVIFLEPKRIYRAVSQPVDDNGEALPLDTCFTLREGSDLTLISWGAMVQETLKAADHLKQQNVHCEVIDVATVSPLDRRTLIASVCKTGRAVIVHEAPRHCGVGAEIAATLQEHCLLDLKAPVKRVTGYDTIMPYLRQELRYMPSVERILSAANEVINFGS